MSEAEILCLIKDDRDNFVNYRKLYLHYLHMNERVKLKLLLDVLAVKFPFEHEIFNIRAKVAVQEKDWNTAVLNYRRCTELKPDDADSADAIGVVCQLKGHFEDAVGWHKKALVLNPYHEGYMFNCAVAYDKSGKNRIAEHKYREIIERYPQNIKSSLNLAILLKNNNRFNESEEILTGILEKYPGSFEAVMETAGLYKIIGNTDAAVKLYEKALELRPGNETADFALKAITGAVVDKPPASYVSSLFDMFSEDFDEKLLSVLDYRVPKIIADTVNIFLNERKNLRFLDLGAGTGLLAPLLRQYVAHGTAVDLSSKMLEKAREKKLYDRYICGDLEQETEKLSGENFDIIAAADVFVYIGNLEKTFLNVRSLLNNDGIFIFSVEENDRDNNSYSLKDTARYGHSEEYIRSIARECGFREISFSSEEIRKNNGKPIRGFIAAYTIQ